MLKNLGEKAKILRKLNGYTLLTISEKLSLTIYGYTSIENGTRQLSLSQLLNICSLYQISVHEFITLGEPAEEITNDNLEALKKQSLEQTHYIAKLQTRIILLEEKLRQPAF